jgi:hypothetical protein
MDGPYAVLCKQSRLNGYLKARFVNNSPGGAVDVYPFCEVDVMDIVRSLLASSENVLNKIKEIQPQHPRVSVDTDRLGVLASLVRSEWQC